MAHRVGSYGLRSLAEIMLFSAWPLDRFTFVDFADNEYRAELPDFEAGLELRLHVEAKPALTDLSELLTANQPGNIPSLHPLSPVMRFECLSVIETTNIPAVTLVVLRDRLRPDTPLYIVASNRLTPGETLTIATARPPVAETTIRNGVARGAFVATPDGDLPVDQLEAGQEILTNHGFCEVKRVTFTRISVIEAILVPDARPVNVSTGALGLGIPKMDTVILPSQKVRLGHDGAGGDSGAEGIAVPASDLIGGPTISSQRDRLVTDIFSVELDQVLLFYVNGIPLSSGAAVARKIVQSKARTDAQKSLRDVEFSRPAPVILN